jgi:hypothetical protein
MKSCLAVTALENAVVRRGHVDGCILYRLDSTGRCNTGLLVQE